MRRTPLLAAAAALTLAAAALAQQPARGIDPYMPFVLPPQGNTPEAAWPVPPGLPPLPPRLGFGTPATPEQIAGWDINVRADGFNLPKGSGTVADGEELYVTRCASCHGDFGEGIDRWPALIGGRNSLNTDAPRRTIGSFWPFAPPVFDYIRRAMPYTAPQSLTVDEYYAITAYVLHLNELLPADATLDQDSIKAVRMPNRDGFILEARPDTPNEPCMTNCRGGKPVSVTMDSRRFVPPGSGSGFSEPQ
jgi:cytochrome c